MDVDSKVVLNEVFYKVLCKKENNNDLILVLLPRGEASSCKKRTLKLLQQR